MYSDSENVCAHCGSDDIREDTREGFTKCASCGFVVDELISWREERTTQPRANFMNEKDSFYTPSLDTFKASSSSRLGSAFDKTTKFGT
jgi:transcription initiation factor TFIIIB Brf1 subunit/transcription initiation factor TFIIB